MTPQQKAGAIIGLGVMLPGLAASGSLPGFELLPFWGWLVIAASAGAAGIAVATGRRKALSAALGAVFGAGLLFVIPLYLDVRSRMSDRYFALELIIPAAMVGLPLLGIWRLVEERGKP